MGSSSLDSNPIIPMIEDYFLLVLLVSFLFNKELKYFLINLSKILSNTFWFATRLPCNKQINLKYFKPS